MGEFFVKGNDCINFLNKLVPQEISNLANSKAVYCQLLNDNGGIIDDLIVYKLEDNDYLIVVNAAKIDEDFEWMNSFAKDFDVEFLNKSDEYSMLAIQGPKAKDLIAKLGLPIECQPEFFTIKQIEFLNKNIFISRTGYTGEDGFEIIVDNSDILMFWNKLLNEGKELGILPIGLGARDTLRLEAALPLNGNDLDEKTTPIEAGLKWSVSKDKKSDYNGKNVIMSQLENGTDKKLIGLKMTDRAIARHEYEIYKDGKCVGNITSGCVSPTTGCNIAMGYVKNVKDICTGVMLQVKIREKFYNAEVVKRPFVQKKYKV